MAVKKQFSPSLRKILAFMLVLVFSVICILTAFIIYTYNSSKESTIQRSNTYISEKTTEINSDLYNVGLYLWESLINNSYIKSIRETDDKQSNNNSARELINNFEYQTKVYNKNYSFMFYCPHRTIKVHSYDKNTEYSINSAIEKYICDLIDMGIYKADYLHWQPYVYNNSLYLLQVYRYKSSYIASWIPSKVAFAPLITFAEKAEIIPLGITNEPLLKNHISAAEELTITNGTVTGGELGKDYFYSSISRANLNLIIIGSPYFDFKNLISISIFIGVILIIVFGFSFYTLYYYKHYIEKPMNALQNHITEYIENATILRTKGFSELNEAASVFDSLTEQIKNLKIQYYEQELTLTKTQLEFYQLQIKPHFFVNCFSIFFSMAQKKDFERIKDFSIKLSNYVRYLFSDSMNAVSIRSELEHIKDYLDILKIRHRNNTIVENSVNPNLLECTIPPLILLTFVENTIKFNSDTPDLLVTIDILPIEGNRKKITVDDNGRGFIDEMIDTINNQCKLPDSIKTDNNTHIGLLNIHKRLQLTYGNEYSIKIHNNCTGGASIEMIIPRK